MTDKRFWWNGTPDGVGSIMDNETGGYLSYSQCIPMLNELHEENQALKLDNKLLLEEMKEIRDKLTTYLIVKGVE